jgi:hypothetical protein
VSKDTRKKQKAKLARKPSAIIENPRKRRKRSTVAMAIFCESTRSSFG